MERLLTHELKTGGDRGYLRIATEEAWATQEQLDAIMSLVKQGRADKGTQSLWGFYGTSPSERTTFIRERLLDVGELRIQAMDESGMVGINSHMIGGADAPFGGVKWSGHGSEDGPEGVLACMVLKAVHEG